MNKNIGIPHWINIACVYEFFYIVFAHIAHILAHVNQLYIHTYTLIRLGSISQIDKIFSMIRIISFLQFPQYLLYGVASARVSLFILKMCPLTEFKTLYHLTLLLHIQYVNLYIVYGTNMLPMQLRMIAGYFPLFVCIANELQSNTSCARVASGSCKTIRIHWNVEQHTVDSRV